MQRVIFLTKTICVYEAVVRQIKMLDGFVNINFLCFGGYRICSDGLNRFKNSGLTEGCRLVELEDKSSK